jgi:hypothetical protein
MPQRDPRRGPRSLGLAPKKDALRPTLQLSASGVRFNDGAGDPLDGIHDTVRETTIEAVVDARMRPYAFWVRTPEPVDWRRVAATVHVRHVTPESGCPSH